MSRFRRNWDFPSLELTTRERRESVEQMQEIHSRGEGSDPEKTPRFTKSLGETCGIFFPMKRFIQKPINPEGSGGAAQTV